MTWSEAQKECQERNVARGTGSISVSRFTVVCVSGRPENLSSGWAVEARPFGHHLDTQIVAD